MTARNELDGAVAGGWNNYPNRVTKKIFYGRECTESQPGTIKQGQVLKAYTFLESDNTGKLIAHSGLAESAQVVFSAALTSGQTIIMGGLVFASGASGTTPTQLALAWSNNGLGISAGTGYAALTGVTNAINGGTFTSGTLAGYNTISGTTATSVLFNATISGNSTDVAVTGTGSAPTVTIVAGTAPLNYIAGITMYDVDATAGDVIAEVYTEASFWGDDDGSVALLWKVSTLTDTIISATGVAVPVTAYNTGCSGTSAASHLLKKKFVENTEFELGFVGIGDRL